MAAPQWARRVRVSADVGREHACYLRRPAVGGTLSQPAATSRQEDAETLAVGVADPERPGRTLKLVARLRPTSGGFQAQLSAGADDCDPELRVLDVADPVTAIMALVELLARAEGRWQTQPRCPAAPRPAPPARARAAPRPTTGTSPTPDVTRGAVPAAAQTATDQLSLF